MGGVRRRLTGRRYATASGSVRRDVKEVRAMQHMGGGEEPLGPVDPLLVPRFAGPATYARLPRLDQVERCDVAVVGVPFDSGVTYRPGARFGPSAIRAGSRLIRGYH